LPFIPEIIEANEQAFREQYGEDVPVSSTKNFTEADNYIHLTRMTSVSMIENNRSFGASSLVFRQRL
jgi:hypothetical protein